MTDDNEPKPAEKQTSFEKFAPWFGAALLVVLTFYLLERSQEVPWYLFGICGALMGVARAFGAMVKGLKP